MSFAGLTSALGSFVTGVVQPAAQVATSYFDVQARKAQADAAKEQAIALQNMQSFNVPHVTPQHVVNSQPMFESAQQFERFNLQSQQPTQEPTVIVQSGSQMNTRTIGFIAIAGMVVILLLTKMKRR